MANSRLSILATLALTLCFAADVVAAQPQAARGRVSTLVRDAEAHLSDKRVDSAIELLLRAAQSLGEVDSDEERDAFRSTVDDMLRQADPLDSERRKVQAEIADRLGILARMYRRRAWYSVSLTLLDAAEELAPGSSKEEREVVETLLRKKNRRSADDAATSASHSGDEAKLLDILENPEILARTRGWRRDPSGIQSPSITDAQTVYLLTSSPQHNDNRIRVEMRIGPKAGKAALAFGVVHQNSYYLAELNQVSDALSSLVLWRVDSSSEMTWLEVAYLELTVEQKADWLELNVDVRGNEVSASINGHTARTTCETPPYGSVGLWISGNSENTEPVHFRNLRIEELPPEGHAENAPAEKSQTAILEERISAAEALLAEKLKEDAVLELRDVRSKLSVIGAKSERQSLEKKIDGLLSKHDLEHKKSQEIRKEVATLYLELAEQYASQDHPLAALAILECAASNDRESARERITQLQAAVGPRPEQEEAESPPGDSRNWTTHEWFDGGRQFNKRGWRWHQETLVSPELLDTRSVYVTSKMVPMTGTASVEMRASSHAGAALVFGWRSKNDFFYLGFDRQGGNNTAIVARWKDETWQTLDRRVIDLPDPQEWVEASIGFHEGAIEIQVGEIGPLMLESEEFRFRGKCGFGLVGWGGGRGGRASFRHFEIEE